MIWLIFERHIVPVVTTTPIILSSNKMQNGDILVSANPGPPGKWPLKRTVYGYCMATAPTFSFCSSSLYLSGACKPGLRVFKWVCVHPTRSTKDLKMILLGNYNWNAVKRHQQWNVTSSHSQDVITKVIDTLRHKLWKNYIPPVNDFLFISKNKLLLIKVVCESFSFVSNNMWDV